MEALTKKPREKSPEALNHESGLPSGASLFALGLSLFLFFLFIVAFLGFLIVVICHTGNLKP